LRESVSIEADIGRAVETRLAALEQEHGVRVLYAAESGSRAWGFPSPDSDFDVRFIYVHPSDWYLSVLERRDVIEVPLDDLGLDVSGWDLRKALRLFLKSNPALYEWLVSPIVYRDEGGLAEELRALAEHGFSRRGLAEHYLKIAGTKKRKGQEQGEMVGVKKYLYTLRPLFALRWLRERETLPPMALPEIIEGIALSAEVRRALEELLEVKSRTKEQGLVPRSPLLDRWIGQATEQGAEFAKGLPSRKPPVEELDALLRRHALAGSPSQTRGSD
jgi:predicted nucleotidyltransferase